MSHCPRKNQYGDTGGDATVRERASALSVSSTESIGQLGTHFLTVASPPVCPKVSHWSRKWDSLVGHFIVVDIIFNIGCPAVPPPMVNRPFGLSFCPMSHCPRKKTDLAKTFRTPRSAVEEERG
jgi:hypothetical protein